MCPAASKDHLREVLAQRYAIGELLGAGGCARVYTCKDLATGDELAIKIILAEDLHEGSSKLARLKREAEVMRQLEHPNVLRIVDIGATERCSYIVMERASTSLYDLSRTAPIQPLDALRWTIQVLSALEYAHSAGVIHRDIKPSNILLKEGGLALLADFGVALLPEHTRHTQVGAALGSMDFMAPEQRLDSSTVTPQADIYAAAATLFHLVTGRSPIDLFVEGPASKRTRDLPPMFRAAILQATRYEPEDRFGSASDFAAALAAAAADVASMTPAFPDRGAQDLPHADSGATQAALALLGEEFAVAKTVLSDGATGPRSITREDVEPTLSFTEQERLSSLVATALLDSSFEERFDRHTRLAQRLFDVPIVAISLVDRDRQWFKSIQGLTVRQTPRSVAFCAHAIEDHTEIFEVSDATLDPRFESNPLVTEDPKIRFYAGMPVHCPRGLPLGTLCIIDREPRSLDEEERQTLQDIAAMVEAEIANVGMNAVDPETGLSNRDGFVLHALCALGHLRREHRPFALVQVSLAPSPFDPASTPAGVSLDAQRFSKVLTNIFSDAEVVSRLTEHDYIVLTSEVGTLKDKIAALYRSYDVRHPLLAPFRWASLNVNADNIESLAVLMARTRARLSGALDVPTDPATQS